MSFCRVTNRNHRNNNSQQYLVNTAQKLRRDLRIWLNQLLESPWSYIKTVENSITEDVLYFPLAIIYVNHQGIQPPA